MKFFFKRLSLFLLIFAIFASVGVSAAHPAGYWPYHVAYNEAVQTGDVDEILKTGNALLDFYSHYPINEDIAANSFNVYYFRYVNSIFEKRGDYEAAAENLEKLLYVSEIAGIKDIDIITEMKMRKINTHTGVFALSEYADSVPYYGAKYELRDGVYYGRIFSTTNYKVNNRDKIKDESIISLYVELGKETVQDYEWILDQVDFSDKALHIAYNFPKEGNTVREINEGIHDENIRSNLRYISNLSQPIFLRIGAEMNVWTIPTEPQEFKDAYIRIANMAREIAPNAALIFSVNYVGYYGNDMSAYYPGDKYVDWVGVSLYCNRYRDSSTCEDGQDFGNMYFGANDWADPVASISEVIERFGDSKPIMITEGGVGNHLVSRDIDLSDFAASRITHAYRALTMVYPQIKGIIYFDTNLKGSDYEYDIEQSPKAAEAFDKAIVANKTLLHHIGDEAMHYVSLENFCEKTNSVSVFAYCNAHYSKDVKVSYYIDNNLYATKTDVVHEIELETDNVPIGEHSFKVVFSDNDHFNKTLEYKLIKNKFGIVQFVAKDDKNHTLHPSLWAVPEIDAADKLNIIPDSLLADFTDNITRDEFCSLIMSLLRASLEMTNDELLTHFKKTVNVNAFNDTKAEDVLCANALGIINGRGNEIFDPDSSISRQEAAVMIFNASKLLKIKKGDAVSFVDKDEFAGWAEAGIEFVSSIKDKISQNSVMGGIGNGKFGPNGAYTREQGILTALRLFRSL